MTRHYSRHFGAFAVATVTSLFALPTMGCAEDEGDGDESGGTGDGDGDGDGDGSGDGDGDGDGSGDGDGDGDGSGDGDGDGDGAGDGDGDGDGAGDGDGDGDGSGDACSTAPMIPGAPAPAVGVSMGNYSALLSSGERWEICEMGGRPFLFNLAAGW